MLTATTIWVMTAPHAFKSHKADYVKSGTSSAPLIGAPIGSTNSAPVFFTLPTAAVTGHISISSDGNGRKRAARPSAATIPKGRRKQTAFRLCA